MSRERIMLTQAIPAVQQLRMQIICTIFLIIRSETEFIRSAVPIKIVIKRRAKQLEGVAREQKT